MESSKDDTIPEDDWMNEIKATIHPRAVQDNMYNQEMDFTHGS